MENQENGSLAEYFFSKRKVRVVEIDGEPWFAARDVCVILEHTNSRRAIIPLDDEDKKTLPKSVYSSFTVTNGYSETEKRGAQMLTFVSEIGLFELIFRSTSPVAKLFKKWVTTEVLPSIRKKGYYVLEQKIAEMKKEIRQGEDRIWELERKAEDPRWMAIRNVRRYICARMYSLDKKCFESGEREYYIYENNCPEVVTKEEFIAQVAALFPEAKIKKVRGHWQFWGIGTR